MGAQNLVVVHYEGDFDFISTLRQLRTKLQSTMKEDRLTGHALMAMNISRFKLDNAVLKI